MPLDPLDVSYAFGTRFIHYNFCPPCTWALATVVFWFLIETLYNPFPVTSQEPLSRSRVLPNLMVPSDWFSRAVNANSKCFVLAVVRAFVAVFRGVVAHAVAGDTCAPGVLCLDELNFGRDCCLAACRQTDWKWLSFPQALHSFWYAGQAFVGVNSPGGLFAFLGSNLQFDLTCQRELF